MVHNLHCMRWKHTRLKRDFQLLVESKGLENGNQVSTKKSVVHYTRAYSSCFMLAIVAGTRLPFFKIFSNFVHFCRNFQIFCPFLPFFWQIARMPLLSRISPVYIDITLERKLIENSENIGWNISTKTNLKFQHSLSKFLIDFGFLL